MHAGRIAAVRRKAPPVVHDAEQERVVRRFDNNPHLSCAGMPMHIGERLLDDTQNGALDLGREIIDLVFDLHGGAKARAPAKPIDELRQRDLQPVLVEARRIEQLAERANLPLRLFDRALHLIEGMLRVGILRQGAAQRHHVQSDGDQLLRGRIVEVERDALPLFVLGAEQTPGEILDCRVRILDRADIRVRHDDTAFPVHRGTHRTHLIPALRIVRAHADRSLKPV